MRPFWLRAVWVNHEDVDRQLALLALLDTADLPCLPRRGYRYTQTRDPKRDPDVIKRDLGTAYVQHVRQTGVDASGIVSLRRRAALRMVPEQRRAK